MADKLKVSFNRDILGDAGDIALELNAANVDLALALAANTPFPALAEPVVLGSASVGIEGGRKLPLGDGTMQVTASAGASARFGLFSSPAQLRDGIVDGGDLAESVETALDFDTGVDAPFLLLRLGYDVNAAASGAVALGAAGTLAFGANVGRDGLLAVAHQPAVGRGARDAVADLVRSLRLPRQVHTADDLLPGTWIIAEADGAVGLRAEIKFGHDLSWIRESSLGTLKGDVGLKVATGVSAALGFNAAGKYAVAISRESPDATERTLRVRVFKLRMRQWNFAFRAEAIVTPVAGLLPNHLDDFIKGVFGIHGTQIVAGLRRVRDWTDPEAPLFGPFVDLAVDEAKALVARITALDDVVTEFTAARQRILDLFERWEALPADVSARLLQVIGDETTVKEIRHIAKKLGGSNEDAVKAFIRERLSDVPFLRSRAGELVQKLAAEGLFAALTNAGLLDALQQNARHLLRVLDGSLIEGMLRRLQQEVDTRLSLDQIEAAVVAADPARLDPWLRARLEDFLEEKLGANAVARLNELRAAIRRLTETAPELYKKAVAALQRDYQFSLFADYQHATTTTALVDAEFDFGVADAEAREGLRVCLAGGFDALIDRPRRGITVHEGVLTHAITRQTNVKVALPYFERSTTHVTQALAQLRAPAQAGGQVFFELEASDVVTVKNQHSASLTVSMLLPKDNDMVRVHDARSASYVQSLDVALTKASVADIADYAGPFVKPLFEHELGGEFSAWVHDAFGDLPGIGNALLSLDVTLPPAACLAWMQAPDTRDAEVYTRLSLALQARFKQLVHDVFFHSVDSFQNVSIGSDAFQVLVFACLTPATGVRLKANRLQLAPRDFSRPQDVHWDVRDSALLTALARSDRARAALAARLATARHRLQAAGDPRDLIPFYKDGQIDKIIETALAPRAGQSLLRSLLDVEGEIVVAARSAALKMAAFRNHQDPARARRDLAEFGVKVTQTFNAKLANPAVGGAIRPLGGLLFITAAETLDPSLRLAASAMLNIADVRDDVTFPPDRFPDHSPVAEGDLVRSETLVHVAE